MHLRGQCTEEAWNAGYSLWTLVAAKAGVERGDLSYRYGECDGVGDDRAGVRGGVGPDSGGAGLLPCL